MSGFGTPLPWVHVDGALVPESQARVSVLANALSYGTGTFEGIRAYWNGEHQRLYLMEAAAHYERLRRSANTLGLPLTPDVKELVGATRELLRRNEVRADAYVRPLLFLGQDRLFVRMHEIEPRLVIAATMIGEDYMPSDGLRCMVSSWRRAPDVSMPNRAKVTGSYIGPALAKTEAIRAGYDEAIMLTVDGYVAESTTSNIVVRDGDEWFSPALTDDILAGITLRQVVQLLREDFGAEVCFRRVQRSELYNASEILLCGTAALVAPVISVDGRLVGDGKPGSVTMALRTQLQAIARRISNRHPEWITPVEPNEELQ